MNTPWPYIPIDADPSGSPILAESGNALLNEESGQPILFELTLIEVDRLAGSIQLQWDPQAGINTVDVYQVVTAPTFDSTEVFFDSTEFTFDQTNESILLQAAASNPYSITGLGPNISFAFYVVANLAGGGTLISTAIQFEYGSTEILTVTPMARPGPYPYFPSVVVQ